MVKQARQRAFWLGSHAGLSMLAYACLTIIINPMRTGWVHKTLNQIIQATVWFSTICESKILWWRISECLQTTFLSLVLSGNIGFQLPLLIINMVKNMPPWNYGNWSTAHLEISNSEKKRMEGAYLYISHFRVRNCVAILLKPVVATKYFKSGKLCVLAY